MRRRAILFCCAAVLMVPLAAEGEVYVVGPDGTGDFPTIQDAIDAAEDGDIIELTGRDFAGPGNQDIDYRGKHITIRVQDSWDASSTITHDVYSTNPAHRTTVSCSVIPTSLSFNVGTIGGSESKTFTIRNTGDVYINGSITSCGEFAVSPTSYGLSPGQSRTVTVSYWPADCGNDNCTVSMDSPCDSEVYCTATGPNTPECRVDPDSLFLEGLVGVGDLTSFTITNIGCGYLNGSVFETCEEIDVISGGYSLGPGEWETFSVSLECPASGSGSCAIGVGSLCDSVICSWSCTGCPSGCPNHFTWTSNTGSTYSIAVQTATWEGGVLPECSEVAVFDGPLCVGAICWEGSPPLAMDSWADDPKTPEIDGYICGHEMTFRIYNYATGEVCLAEATYTQGNGTFCSGIVSVVSLDASCCQEIPLGGGWNCVSSYFAPPDPAMEAVWANVIAAGHLNIVKNDCGEGFCLPGVICNIDWNPYSCYMAHLSAPDALVMCGTPIPEEGPVSLEQGWNCLPFFPLAPLAPEEALASCWDHLNLVKNNCTGEFCIPGVYCGIAAMNPGECYMAHMAQACDLHYPSRGGMRREFARGEILRPEHFPVVRGTGATYSIVARDPDGILNRGDEVGVFHEDLCVGAGIWTGGPVLGITVWGDDITTEVVDGCVDGDILSYRVWNAGNSEEYAAGAVYVAGDGTYGAEPYAMINLQRASTDVDEEVMTRWADHLSQNYPNPFTPETVISYSLSGPGRVVLRVFDVEGKQVRVLSDRMEAAGNHRVSWDGKDDAGRELAAGIYFYRLETPYSATMKKMVLVK